ncbi:tRNA (adenine(22)-N(1))-methyltransferase TrmK [Bacillus sp. AFS076308]|uniref:tRNA (adenine(22)-N(1))-methyltransferase n=1 Tax=unclassified Bacillus (in: firmicutes) TaxID=185979 RepID=UPI000BF4C1C9|nr:MULTISPECIES: tRNA (adenine(22)-N(1))-methyltransferase TrmK [unclassified Bacillus (in: firmicutes)]PFO03687.1 tRNA (adenine(22)-N(1))-methyltransferase TrmK [Bacillus sp. AFS076308]PGV54418.1 tRNA (adenine(22)-N(1))-methyltransferase TrmK [Bacillus sp. AFS037270]
MNTDKLSVRLTTVAKYVIDGARMADIGSDHAYLPCYLAKNLKISFAIAGEVAQGPFQSTEKNVLAEGLVDTIAVRMGDGLEVIEPGEVDCITIAGMGGALISSILDNGKDKLDSVQRLILQPNISAISIRTWLLANNWELIAEEIIEEDSKIYEILVAERGDPLKPYQIKRDEGLLLGPFLLKQKNEIFKKKWTAEMNNWQRISKALEGASETVETIEKRQELTDKIKLVEGVLK